MAEIYLDVIFALSDPLTFCPLRLTLTRPLSQLAHYYVILHTGYPLRQLAHRIVGRRKICRMEPPQEPPQWTQYNQQQPPAWPSLNYNPPPIPQHPRSWFERQIELSEQSVQRWARSFHLPVPVIWVAILLVVLCTCSFWSIAGISALMSPGTPSSAHVSATATAQATATSVLIVATAPPVTTGPPPTPVPTATPMPTATPSNVVLQLSGNGDKTTASFTVHGTWEIAWICGPNSYGFLAQIYDASTNDYASQDGPDYNCPDAGGGDSSIIHGGGTFYLSIICGGDWILTVTDLPN